MYNLCNIYSDPIYIYIYIYIYIFSLINLSGMR